MNYKRACGILLHPTSLPGPDGIGDLGPEAYRWVNFLEASGCGLWQVLPLAPTGYGDSPYQTFSAFAGNPYLISPTLLLEDGLLTHADLADRPIFSDSEVMFGEVINWKLTLLDRAYQRFQKNPPAELVTEFEAFQEKEKDWLLDFALFMAIKQDNQYAPWDQWPEPLRLRLSTALDTYRSEHADPITNIAFRQFLFFRQWDALHKYANEKSIAIIGDIPIFVAFDSADAWANKELFYIDPSGQPSVVAGVPPDYFSPTGQLWGNPLYRWSVHKASGYEWWIKRMRATLRNVDIIRLDHFRGFGGYWEVPFGNTTAEHGRWVQGPGADLFNTIQEALGTLPIIAEDLGEITQDVIDLRDQFSLPGMKVLQFSFLTDPHDPFMPHNFIANSVCYTGTHDNDTSIGWFKSAPEHERDFCRRYFARSGEDIAWDMIRAAWESVSVMALAPMQDVLRLGTEARMNYPGRPYGNWTWRMPASALSNELAAQLREYARLYNRLAKDDTPRPTRNLINYEQAAS